MEPYRDFDRAVTFFLGLCAGVLIVINITSNPRLERYEQKSVFVWNDDEESIPMDGELIRLEFTEGDTIYIGPKD
tara:strand:+ start:841 stop:1065 length:225 start_codon:yes stop_codon:yes gene_type:complete